MKHRVILVLLLGLPAMPVHSQSTARLEGRIIHAEGRPTGGVALSFGPYGTTIARSDGFFTHHFPEGTAEATVQIEDQGWTVLYPRNGRVVIPADEDVVIEIVVGDPIEEVLARSLAEKHQQLLAGLSGLGAEQEQIRTALESFLEELRQRVDLDEAEFQRALDNAAERREHYPAIAAALNDYTLRAADVRDAFRLLAELAIRNPGVIHTLDSTLLAYNDAYRTIHNRRPAFEQAVADFWQNERITAELRAVFDYAEGDVHRTHILQLNDSIVTLHELAAGRDRNGAEVSADIRRIVDGLDPRLAELERRTERILQSLFTD